MERTETTGGVAAPRLRLFASASPEPTSVERRIAALSTLETLHGLTAEEYGWLAVHATERVGPDGCIVFYDKEPSHHLVLILQGDVYVRRWTAGILSSFMGRASSITGKLPFSRMKAWGAEGRCDGPFWALDIHEDDFPAMLQAIPSMGQRCVSLMLDRVREFTRAEEQAQRLSALNKLAANLAHELNNPAAAAQRAGGTLNQSLPLEDDAKYSIGLLCESQQELDCYRAWTAKAAASIAGSEASSSSLESSDREDQFYNWLSERKVSDPWRIAPTFAESGLSTGLLDELAASVSSTVLPHALSTFAASLRNHRSVCTVLSATSRIFTIVDAIKDYSYMDQAPIQDVDLALALDNTLSMFESRLAGINVERQYDPTLPTLRAFGSELNQVWTALIENALDAMQDGGTLSLSTHLKSNLAFVEIRDSGNGIDPAIIGRIFEPFFTTKPLGTALGLGLDSVQRIVSKHFGSVSVDSAPGFTCFQVRLPLDRNQIY